VWRYRPRVPSRDRPVATSIAFGVLIGGALTLLLLTTLRAGDAPYVTPPSSPAIRSPALEAAVTDAATSPQDHRVWARAQDGSVLRWDACRPLELVVSRHRLDDERRADVAEAVRRLREASGLQLVVVGETDEVPRADRPLIMALDRGWAWAPVLIGWVEPRETDLPLLMIDRGVALPVAVRDGEREAFVTGQIALNAARTDLRSGFADRSDAWGSTLLHELGHLVGLDHVDDPRQLMSAAPGSGPVVFGAGDLAGFARIGAPAGCRPAPSAAAGRDIAPSSAWATSER
jgi:hypothetical protein